MKKNISNLLVFLLFSYSLFSQGLNDVSSPGSNVVIAVGYNGLTLRSTNGGDYFSRSIVGSSDLKSVFSLSNYAWSVGISGKIYISSNSGISWLNINSGSTNDLQSVYFLNNSTGYICGSNGTILKSTTSGNSWITLSSGTTSNLNDIKFKNTNTGFVCGANGIILKTTDGGITWLNLNTGINKEILSIDIKLNIIFVTGKRNAVYKSSNEGLTWQYIDYRLTTYSDVNCLFMLDENIHYSCGGGGFIRKSTDGGINYVYQSNPMLAKLNSIYFIDGNTGWAVSEKNNVVLKTTNGGNNWLLYTGTQISYNWQKVLSIPTNHYISGKTMSINHQNPDVLFAAGGNIMYRSQDQGSTWSQAFIMPTYNLCAGLLTNHYDSNKFLVILYNNTGGNANLFRTTNYGTNWQMIYNGILDGGGMPIEEDPMHPDTIYFGASGSLFRSTNFGANLNPISNLPISRFCDIAVSYFNPDDIFVSTHFKARLFKSTNGGINFINVDSSTVSNSEMPAVVTSAYSTFNIYHVYILNTFDALRKSTDGGNIWFNGYSTPFMWGMDLAKDDPNILYSFNYDTIGVDRSFVNISFDNGSTYTQTPIRQNLPGNIDQSIYNIDRANCFDLYGNEIYKLYPVYSTTIGIQQISSDIPIRFSLSQNYPNPFNPETNIEFSLPYQRYITIKIFDINGKEIERLFNGKISAGKFKITWDASAYASGIYFYSISTENIFETKKMILLK